MRPRVGGSNPPVPAKFIVAGVVELVDTIDLSSIGCKLVQVRPLSPVPKFFQKVLDFWLEIVYIMLN